MRILVVGAGGIGGYFGGRLLAAGRDVTFLVRPARAALLARQGLMIRSTLGDLDLANPPTVLSEAITQPYDLVLLSCKAYDLDGAIESVAPAVGPDTAILPMLNGMDHLDRLAARFGEATVLGGLALISVMLDGEGRIRHYGPLQSLVFGELQGGSSPRVEAISALFAGQFDSRLSLDIRQEMWEKWAFIATAAGITSLMRSPIGDIVSGGGAPLTEALIEECRAIATSQGFAPRERAVKQMRDMLLAPGSGFTASMLRDIESGGAIEADHVIGALLARGQAAGLACPMLTVILAHLKTYEARRARLAG